MLSDGATISTASSGPSSPRQRLKFLCSYGGKILPRPSDGQLKYVGGQTRVISVPRDISFQEVMKRLTYVIDEEMILKYQLVWDDLDALVCVKGDEDLSHMFDEIEHYEIEGCPRMHAFLFPANHHNIAVDQSLQPDQHYIYSINGINTKNLVITSLASSSTCSSPGSPHSPSFTPESSMHKIQSSPTISCNKQKLVRGDHGIGMGLFKVENATSNYCHYYDNNYFREINRGSGCCTNYVHMHPFQDTRFIERQATLP